ncbi:Phospholipid scramblase 1, partial [Galemys pyrenaicus]
MEFSGLQPTIRWMQTPQPTPSCPPGLEDLSQINQLLVCQRFDQLKDLSHCENNKIYEVMNNQRQRIYFAEEKRSCFLRYLCGSSRPFTMTIYDTEGRDVITMHKALSCGCCWNNCFLQKLLPMDEERVIGNISNADKFRIQFPFDLDVKIKALMLGASFL